MILVCSKCNASYLVPASVFVAGARAVRCARCGYTWQADLPSQITAVLTPEVRGPEASAMPPFSSPSPESTRPVAASSPTDVTPGGGAQNLPTVWHAPRWEKIKAYWPVAAGFLLVVLLVGVAFSGKVVAKIWPQTELFYTVLGLPAHHAGDGFILRQVRSERRYESGGMQLAVEGEVFNDSPETRLVPDLMVAALGPSGGVIQSWRIDAPAATLEPGAGVPFTSSILSPQGTVVEVNLSFVRPQHDPKP
ncbi:MAG: hypothetical protein HGA90_06555 [Alphaproteobacteria bacterium]|nr:hypothetical protein [Alphaproteobacteria bacterium]